ncbi:Xaa-Pro aminopeptidase [Streptomyces ambofaciens]|uniref:Xaa-Pro aminopeptidase n=1 Tax=Streptomyces ambofaciens TaxID=1889 RepID=A0ABN4P7P2_STRAM|nr:Xaa-Pro aminopeptidase [Streptomyces ambofaciens]
MTTAVAAGHRTELRGHGQVRRLALAHRADRARGRRRPPRLSGVGTQALKDLASDAPHGRREGRPPRWSPYRFSGPPPRPGSWVVGPRFGFRGMGARSEEIRVVADSADPEASAFRLDDDLPHVRRWAEEE